MCFSVSCSSPDRSSGKKPAGSIGLARLRRSLPTLLGAKPAAAGKLPSGFHSSVFVPEHHGPGLNLRYATSVKVGAGACGGVFVADDLSIPGRQVAVKTMDMTTEPMEGQYHREVEIMKTLDHPNICKLYETYQDFRSLHLVMEYCGGGDVYTAIGESQAQGRHGLGEELSAHVVRQVAEALKYAHGRGVVHRDLKPENICFVDANRGADCHIKVIDWGISSDRGLKRMRTSCGTSLYAAPEVLQVDHRGGGYTAACDAWSLGVVIYGALSGTAPFGGTMPQQYNHMLVERVPMSSGFWHQVSSQAKDLIRGLLRARPGQRLSLGAVLAHPWLQQFRRRSPSGAAHNIVSHIQDSQDEQSELRLMWAAACARQMDHESLKDFAQAFDELDLDKDGLLSVEELRRGFEAAFGTENELLVSVDDIFRRCNLDKSGMLNYSEFCAAGLNYDLPTDDNKLKAVLCLFANCGTVPPAVGIMRSLFEATLRRTSIKDVDKILARWDADCDGVLDLQAWRALLRSW